MPGAQQSGLGGGQQQTPQPAQPRRGSPTAAPPSPYRCRPCSQLAPQPSRPAPSAVFFQWFLRVASSPRGPAMPPGKGARPPGSRAQPSPRPPPPPGSAGNGSPGPAFRPAETRREALKAIKSPNPPQKSLFTALPPSRRAAQGHLQKPGERWLHTGVLEKLRITNIGKHLQNVSECFFFLASKMPSSSTSKHLLESNIKSLI